MFWKLKSSLVYFLVLLNGPLIAAPAYGFRVLIDPGHGGRDAGARQDMPPSQSLTEADLTWAWGLELKRSLQEKGIEVQLSRSERQGPSISQRIQQTQNKSFDLVISLHANSILDPRAKGVEYYIAAPQSLEDQVLQLAHEESMIKSGSKKAAALNVDLSLEKKSQVTAILNDLENQARLEKSLFVAQSLNQAWPGKIKQGPFDLLIQSQSPAVLIELGFISNPQDFNKLKDPQFRQLKATDLAEALSRYLKRQNSPQL